MKRTLLLAGALSIGAFASRAQWVNTGTATYYNPLGYNVGIGTTNPTFKLDVRSSVSFDDGLRIMNQNGSPSVYLNNTGPGGSNWAMQSNSTGHWLLTDLTTGQDAIRAANTGQVYIGPSSSTFNGKLHTYTDNDIYGILVDNASQAISGNAFPIGMASFVPGNGAAGTLTRSYLGDCYGGETNTTADFRARYGTYTRGIQTLATGASNTNYGADFEADATASPVATAIGVNSVAEGNGLVAGIIATAKGSAPSGAIHYGGLFNSQDPTNMHNIGSVGVATGGTSYNVGVAGWVNASGPSLPLMNFMMQYPQANIGVYGCASLWGSYASPSNSWAGWFDNDVMINGTGYSSGFTSFTSDRKFKKDIKTIDNASSIIAKLNPSTYFMTTDNQYGLNFSNKKQYGFISQEVEAILPDLVTDVHKPASVNKDNQEVTKEVDFKALNYMGFIALLTRGLQEQQTRIDAQQKQIDELKDMIRALASSPASPTTTVDLSDKNAIVLDQNVPNPFAESTTISYNIPAGFSRAQLIFTTTDGKTIKTVDINQTGAGKVNVFAGDLSNGIYSYTLIVDGKTIDAKKMLKN